MRLELSNATEYQNRQCLLFASYSVATSINEYKKRNQLDVKKIELDIYNGKLAEFMVYNYLVSKGRILASPDLNIYQKYQKSYDSDLCVNGVKIHVKSHVSNKLYPVSWLFQKNDPLIITHNEDYLALVVFKFNKRYMYLKKRSEVSFLEPIKNSLKANKLCLYESQFKKS